MVVTMSTDFGRKVRAVLAERGMTIRAAARALNYDHAYLSRVLNGKQAPSPQLAESLDLLLSAGGALVELAAVLTSDDRDRITYSLNHPSRVDGSTVAALGDVLTAQRRLDDAIGPHAMLPSTLPQIGTVTRMLKEARGPHRDSLAEVVAEYVQFGGWLHAEARNDREAVTMLDDAENLADEVGVGTLAAHASSFRGWLARQQGRPRGVARWFSAAYHTPGAHPAQRMDDAAQAAQGLAVLGEREAARRLLGEAADLADAAWRQPHPRTAHWPLTETFQRLNMGLAHLSLQEYREATEHISAGLSGLPADQRNAVWTAEYRQALEEAEERK